MVDRTELIPSESLGKKCILLYRLHPPFAGIEVAQYLHFSRHGTFGNIKQTVKVQTVIDNEQQTAVEMEQTAQNPDNVQEKSAPPAVRQMTRKELFDELYQATFGMKKSEQKSYIVKEMLPYFKDGSSCRAFVEQNFERKHRNMICRRTRLWRKINHQRFNYFVTFTYADDKMTEEEFAKKLLNTLYHFSNRKGWLYIGAWERGGETNRFFIVNRFLDFDDFLMARPAVLCARIGYVRNTYIMAPVRIYFDLTVRHSVILL